MIKENMKKTMSWVRDRLAEKKRVTRSVFGLPLLTVIWTVVLISLFAWQTVNSRRHINEVAIQQGRDQFLTLMLTRRWNAQHGGVYVPITEQTQPNPYLDDPRRDVTTTSGLALTKINPAYMTRQIAEIAAQGKEVKFHITSLNPIRPANGPDAWESAALNSFSAGAKERFEQKGGIFRYMAPLRVERPCLKCHSKQGYREGDLRGGISVSFPAELLYANQKQEMNKLAGSFIAIWLVVMALMTFNAYKQKRYLKAIIESETTLKKNEELEQSNEELRSIVHSISHDLRRPLVNLQGFSTELGRALREFHPLVLACAAQGEAAGQTRLMKILQSEIPEMLSFIRSSTDLMGALVNSFLMFSLIGSRKLKPELIDMEALVRTVLTTLAPQISENGIAVTVGKLPPVVADRVSLEQVMRNILDNAVKYRDPDRAGAVKITGENSSLQATFHVRDNGRGIATYDIHKVFEFFQRAGKQDVPGEGMGLAYVKTLVRRHGGRIWCESEPGKGTTFSFTIPDKHDATIQEKG